ncbi:MAG TPA: type II toxin-antitoxin system HicA family toxin [Chloroflexota bacterium]|jgi:predicted RNA binding protein YcfA (HicA-like mRNA interferase family)
MPGQLPQVTERQVLRALARVGWYISRQRGHTILAHPTKRGIIPVPRHRGPLKPGTLRSILESAGLTEDEFKALL